jgi:RimJ/RimL family protein N-acetyltransferase
MSIQTQFNATQQGRLRVATLEDHALLCQMILEMAKDSEGVELNPDTLSKGVRAVFEDPTKGAYWFWVNPIDPKEIWASCLITSEWSDWHNRNYVWLQSVYIPPFQRGKGVLGEFLNALGETLREQQGHEIRLYVDEHNQRAIQAYLKTGFETSHYQMMIRSLSTQ